MRAAECLRTDHSSYWLVYPTFTASMAGEKPLSNDDFRKLLMTPRPDMAPNIQAQAAAKKQKATRHPHPQKPTGAKPSGKGDAEAEAEAGYRDRAAERRMGLDSEWNGLASGMGMPQDISRLSYDESKYLGGDEEHTHLVKGLDYALLSKVRSERGAKEDQKALQGTKDGALQSKLQGPSFRTPLSRAIYDFLFGRQQVLVRVASSERFLPRRTAFVYTMAERDTAEVPTTLNRAKEDCPKPQPSLNGGVDLAVLERLAKIMAYTSLSSEWQAASYLNSIAIATFVQA